MKNILFLLSIILIISCSSDSDKDEQKQPVSLNNKANWIEGAFETIKAYPSIKGAIYWNEQWEQYDLPANLMIDSSSDSQVTYKKGIGDSYFVSDVIVESMKIVPPVSGVYHSAYPGFIDNNREVVTQKQISDFETKAGKSLAWVYFSNDWQYGISFPLEQVGVVNSAGRVPFIRMIPWSSYQIQGADPVYSMQAFIDGKFDADLRKWAQDAKAVGIPLMVEFGTEVNGDWFPWNGKWNGGDVTDGYGDPALPDGPERFRDAYRHIIDLFRSEGVSNITWAFHVNGIKFPDEEWNSMKAYYPGDEYIDWIGVSIYGPLNVNDPSQYSFRQIFENCWSEFSSISSIKPLAIFEYGCGEH